MHEGYGSHFVRLSVTEVAATYLVYTLKVNYHTDFNVCIVWTSLETFCLKVLASFADHLFLLHFLSSSCLTKVTAMLSFQEE